jgi:hypothetical protein
MKKLDYHLTVFVGDTDDSVSISAQEYDSSAFLIDFNNYEDFFNNELLKDTTVYTSLGDLPKDPTVMQNLLLAADEIFYCPPTQWSDKKSIDVVWPLSCIQGLTEHLLLTLTSNKKIHNFDRNNLVPDPVLLVDQRQSDESQLWIAGCSISHGIGVELNERYGHLVADALKMSCSFLTRPGSAIDWSADQIVRSDIRPSDIVVWGITSNARLTFVHGNKLLQGVNNRSYDIKKNLESIVPKKTLISQNTFYKHIYSIKQVINFCNKCQARLIIVGLLTSNSTFRYLATLPEYHHYPYQQACKNNAITDVLEDYGTDGSHPGPIQHKRYADFILNLI